MDNNLKAIFEFNPTGMLIIDEHATIKQTNPYFMKMMGQGDSAVIGRKLGDAIGCMHSLEKGIRNVLESGAPSSNLIVQAALLAPGKDTPAWYKISFIPIVVGGITHVMAIRNTKKPK